MVNQASKSAPQVDHNQAASLQIRLRTLQILPVGASDSSEPEVSSSNPLGLFPTIHEAADQFAVSMRSQLSFTKAISRMADRTSALNFSNCITLINQVVLDSETGKSSKKPVIAKLRAVLELTGKGDAPLEKEVLADIRDQLMVKQLSEFSERHTAAVRILNDTAIQQMANSWERLLGNMLAARYVSKPLAIPDDRQITYAQLLRFKSMDEAKAFVISQEMDRFTNERTEKQIELLDKHVNGKLKDRFPQLPFAIEVLLRRHALVHGGGAATPEYINRLEAVKGFDGPIPKVGEGLVPNRKYVRRAWSLMYSLGVLAAELCWKQLAKDEDAIDESEGFVNISGYEAMVSGDYTSAELIFEAVHNLQQGSDYSAMAKINLAIAKRALGKKGWEELVSEKKWRNSAPLYSMGAAAVREDEPEFRRQLHAMRATDENFDPYYFYEWPAFQWIKAKPEYGAWIEAEFGKLPVTRDYNGRFAVLFDGEIPNGGFSLALNEDEAKTLKMPIPKKSPAESKSPKRSGVRKKSDKENR